jgi:hypothetical protein
MLATRVAITRTRRGGRISIEFGSDEELDRLIAWILRNAGEREPEPIAIGVEGMVE